MSSTLKIQEITYLLDNCLSNQPLAEQAKQALPCTFFFFRTKAYPLKLLEASLHSQISQLIYNSLAEGLKGNNDLMV